MNTSRKNLKDFSILILFLLGLTVVRLVLTVALGGFDKVPEGITPELYQIALIVFYVITFLICLPDLYIGIKGLKVAKKPDESKGHIVWAKILFVITVIAIVSSVGSLFNATDIGMQIFELVDVVLSALTYFFYIKYATEVCNNVKADS